MAAVLYSAGWVSIRHGSGFCLSTDLEPDWSCRQGECSAGLPFV